MTIIEKLKTMHIIYNKRKYSDKIRPYIQNRNVNFLVLHVILLIRYCVVTYDKILRYEQSKQ